MRLAPVEAIGPSLLDFSASVDANNPLTGYNNQYGDMHPGTILYAVGTDFDLTANVSNWGEADLVYVTSVNAAAVLPGTLVQVDKNWRITTTAASEANTGKPVYVVLTNFSAGNVLEQGGWVMRRGICPVRYSVAATAGAVFGGTAGVATPTPAAGVQIGGMRCLTAAAATFTRNAVLRNGSSLIKMGNLNGLYLGQAVSGTGIPGGAVVSQMNPDGTSFILGSAIGTPVNVTAGNNQILTFTNTGYGICQINYPTFQTQIT